MERVEAAIESAYEDHIAVLYKVLTESMLAAKGNGAEMAAAQDRFKHALAFAADVRARAREAAGIQ